MCACGYFRQHGVRPFSIKQPAAVASRAVELMSAYGLVRMSQPETLARSGTEVIHSVDDIE